MKVNLMRGFIVIIGYVCNVCNLGLVYSLYQSLTKINYGVTQKTTTTTKKHG